MVAYQLDLAEVLYNLELEKGLPMSKECHFILLHFIAFIERALKRSQYLDFPEDTNVPLGEERAEACFQLVDLFVMAHLTIIDDSILIEDWLYSIIINENRCLVI